MGTKLAVGRRETTSLLLVDDDAAVLKMTRRTLERSGYDVVACSSGEEALRQLANRAFDVMLSDVHMPGTTGLRLLRAVRERDMDIPVVLITGNPDVPTAIAAVEYGAFQYLIKPVPKAQLEEAIERAVSAGRLARAKREYVQELGSGVFPVGDRAGADASLDRALTSLWMAFQPIVAAADGSVFAHEALMRTTDATLSNPGAVLEAAGLANRLHDVGGCVRAKVADAIASTSEHLTFFVNLHPEDLLDPSLYGARAPLASVAGRTVLEITECVSLEPVSDLPSRIARLREMGFRIALDDLGAGYAGLTSFVALEPEFVKLDMSLIREIHCSDAKQKIVGTMVDLCHEMDKRIIAEGVEHPHERDTLVELGCDFMQGYLLARPGPAFPVPVGGTSLTEKSISS